MRKARPAAERIDELAQTQSADECWIWTGGCFASGHGRARVDGRQTTAHRAAWLQLVGPVPDDLHVDHLCCNPPCVNPAHMELVTCGENVLRGTCPAALNARKTHCKRGHPLEGENLRILVSGNRNCRECERKMQRQRRARKRELATA